MQICWTVVSLGRCPFSCPKRMFYFSLQKSLSSISNSCLNYFRFKFCRLFFLPYLYECFICMHVWAPSIHTACSGQKKISDPLELEWKMAVRHHVGTENKIWVPSKSSYLLSHLSTPSELFWQSSQAPGRGVKSRLNSAWQDKLMLLPPWWNASVIVTWICIFRLKSLIVSSK